MKIIKLKKIDSNKYSISLKNHDDIILFDETILKYELLQNKEIEENTLEEMLEFNNSLIAYYKALKYLNFKLRTKKEIKDYLKKYNFSNKVINDVIVRLEKQEYINENIYIKLYINDQIKLTLNGPLKIKNNLLSLNLNEEEINNCLENITSDIWQEKINKIINKKIKTNKNSEQKFKIKMKKYLSDQGFYIEDYLDIVNKIKIEDNNIFNKKAEILLKKLSKKYNGLELYNQLKNKLYYYGFKSEDINNFINKIKSNDII